MTSRRLLRLARGSLFAVGIGALACWLVCAFLAGHP